MFSELTDFSKVRSGAQALGFYLAFSFFGAVIGGLAGGIAGVVAGARSVEQGVAVAQIPGHVAGILFVLFVGGAICVQKSLSIGHYLVAAISGFLAIFGGSVLGMIPVAWLTTRAPGKGETNSTTP